MNNEILKFCFEYKNNQLKYIREDLKRLNILNYKVGDIINNDIKILNNNSIEILKYSKILFKLIANKNVNDVYLLHEKHGNILDNFVAINNKKEKRFEIVKYGKEKFVIIYHYKIILLQKLLCNFNDYKKLYQENLYQFDALEKKVMKKLDKDKKV